ncbi:MAG: type I-C CRISPR-associated protein Cas7/Csd2 [Thermomicrobiales bacterium]
MTVATDIISAHVDPAKRHEAVLLFDVTDGNPNGDPDSGNLPRVDPETMQGLVSDVAIKRKIRDFVDAAKGGEETFKIYVQSEEALNSMHLRAYTALNLDQKKKSDRNTVAEARDWMCQNFFDVRTFGAVMSTAVNAGQVRGPVQITFARSFDAILPLDLSITRIAITKPEDMLAVTEDGEEGKNKRTEMGRKALVPYGLYKANVFFTPQMATRTGFSSEDLALVWDALVRMWDLDRSASRGLMACQGLYVFSHDNALGNAPAHKLLQRVQAELRPGVIAPRSVSDYDITVNTDALPDGVTLTRLA